MAKIASYKHVLSIWEKASQMLCITKAKLFRRPNILIMSIYPIILPKEKNRESLPDNFLFSKPPQFQPLLKYWGHLKNFYLYTTNSVGVDGKNSPSTPQIVVSKVNFRRPRLQKFTFDTDVQKVGNLRT